LVPLVVRVERTRANASLPWPPPNGESMSIDQWVAYRARYEERVLYFNSQRISWDRLGPLLDKELLRRPPEWPVYVRGDGDVELQSVLRAIDIIRGKRAQVVLLTDWGKSKPK
jgi:biopolymer transport protein ExbD